MTPQEQQLLEGLTTRINQTVLPDKDPQAEQYLNQSLGRNPDALYILAQTVLVQQYALDQAKKQLDEAKQQAQQQQQAPAPVKHTSFLGSLLGTDERQAPPPPPPPQQQYGQPQYAPVPNYPPPAPSYTQSQYGQPQYAPAQAGGGMFGGGAPVGGSGFLGSALRTAGTVAAGAIAFEGIEHLMHGFGEHAGYGGGSNFGEFGGGQPREEIVNNYYGDSAGRGGVSRDIEDRRDDDAGKRGFADTDANSSDDNSSDDDSSDDSDYVNDGSSDDDSGTFDDSSSDDMGSDDTN